MSKVIPSRIRLKTDDFRAIKSAEIIIDGITVVAGENGCGKSSLSKLLYFLYKTVSNYDYLVLKNLNRTLRDVIRYFEIFEQEISFGIKDRQSRNEFRKEIGELRRLIFGQGSSNIEYIKEAWLSLTIKMESMYGEFNENNPDSTSSSIRLRRLRFILSDLLKKPENEIELDSSFELLRELIITRFKTAEGIIASRPISVFKNELMSVFSDGILPKSFEIYEFDEMIVSLDKNYVAIPFDVQNAIYIDTPMMLSVEDSHNDHWTDLNNLLVRKSSQEDRFAELISDEIIQGDVDMDESTGSSEDLIFKRKDGAVFNLIDVATGIKAFSIIQLLLKGGRINDKTLLIIDEPESHLHPQWIIEYARLIVLLNKHYGVKFFIASHNPDMVSAIRYISEKEQTLDQVNFYLAERIEKSYMYNYKYLQKEIDPIFASFNIALDRVHQYGI